MNIEKIYVTRKKDKIESEYPFNWVNLNKRQKEILVYEVMRDWYKDLIGDIFYTKEELYIDDMVSLGKRIGLKGSSYVSKSSAIQIYHADQHKLLNIKDLYIGNVGYIYSLEPTLENRLFWKDVDSIVDLESYDRYTLQTELTVTKPVPYSKVFPEEAHKLHEEKAKVLDKFHQKF